MAGRVSGALIVTAELAREDFAWLDALRREHYPPERNRVPAHLTLIRSLPPSAEGEVRRILAKIAAGPPPRAWVAGASDIGGAVAFRIASDELDALRRELVEQLHGLLSAQDARGWSAHVTIQNKVEPRVARSLARALSAHRAGDPLRIAGLGLYRYLGGAWERLQLYPFRGR
jgi:2'-5' RNA ligase